MAKQTAPTTPIPSREPDVALRRIITATVLCGLLALYLCTLFALYPRMPIITPNATEVPGYVEQYPPFRVDEYTYYRTTQNILDGRAYAQSSPERSFPIGYPLAAAPFVALFGAFGGYLVNALIMGGCLALLYFLFRRAASQTKALVLTGIMATATLNWFYAVSAYAEPLAQILVLGSYLLLTAVTEDHDRTKRFLSGILIGLTLFVRPHYMLLAAPFLLYPATRRSWKPSPTRGAVMFILGTGTMVVLWMIRNIVVFGSPLTFEYSNLAGSFAGQSGAYMSGNILLGIHQLFFDSAHGLFTITPVFLLFPAGLHGMWRAGLKREAIVLMGSAVLVTGFVAAGPYPFTEFGLGSRHLVPLLPLLWYPVSFFLDGRAFSRGLVTMLAAYSFYFAGIGWFTGGEPGMGIAIGILNDAQTRAVILSRKGMLPRACFTSREDLIDTYRKALENADLYRFLQTLNPAMVQRIEGTERPFMLSLRREPDPTIYIESADPDSGIVFRDFTINQ